jgi:two-component sensor histidine kinase
MATGRPLDRLLQRAWLPFVVAAIVLAAPVLVLGQASDEETRSRLRAEELQSTAYMAEVVARTYSDRIVLMRNSLASLALSPRPDTSLLGIAVRQGEVGSLQQIADIAQSPRFVTRAYIAVRGDAETIANARILAVSPADASSVGRHLSDLSAPVRGAIAQLLGTLQIGQTGALAAPYSDGPERPSVLLMAASIPGNAPGDVQRQRILSPAVLIAEADNARIFADAAGPSLGLSDDAYSLNPDHRLIGRARGPIDYPLRDMSGDPVLDLVTPLTPTIARAGANDPLGGGTRVIASAPVSINASYPVIVLRDASRVDQEVDRTLAQLAAFRVLIVVMLVMLVGLGGFVARDFAAGAVHQERLRLARDLHDLLGHSLSLLTIKTQVARRMLASSDAAGAEGELTEMERVARESLQDVRQAVEGYRQPTFSSALVGARAALAAAGIDSRLENGAGPLPAAADATLAWIVREAVTNVIRHSRATTCSIRLTRRADQAWLEVTDNGQRAAPSTSGSGLRGLEERAAARGGHAEAGPLPEGGFRVQVSIPV